MRELRREWGAGRGLARWMLRELFFVAGGLSRRQFVVSLVAWLVLGAGVFWVAAGEVSWWGVGAGAFALPAGAGWGLTFVLGVMWAGIASAVVRRWRDAGWRWWLLWPVAFCVIGAPAVSLPALGLLLGVWPAQGWLARWGHLWRVSRAQRRVGTMVGSDAGAAAGRERSEPAPGVAPGAPATLGASRAGVDSVPRFASDEEALEWLHGAGDEPEEGAGFARGGERLGSRVR